MFVDFADVIFPDKVYSIIVPREHGTPNHIFFIEGRYYNDGFKKST